MTTDPSVVTADMGLGQVREIMMRQHRVALPVIDDQRQVIGLLTQEDLLQDHQHDVRVADVMHPSPEMAYIDQHILDIVPLISKRGWRTMSILDRQQKLQGIITRSDIIRALLSLR
jgi:CBS-domain-containing membrane protein